MSPPPKQPPTRTIPRVWEIDWALPPEEGGTPWEAYDWAFDTADECGVKDITIVGATYDNLGELDWAIDDPRAAGLRALPHSYRVGPITVTGVSRRGSWNARGVVIVAWANDRVLSDIEGQHPTAIAAVATWPDSIPGWRSVHKPDRIGQVRPDQEAQFDTATITGLDPRAVKAIDSAGAWVNESHAVLDTDERKAVAGALIALRSAGIPVDPAELRAHLMTKHWSGGLIEQTIEVARRVADGRTPQHRPFQLCAAESARYAWRR
jgi:hypothetical protein